MLRENRVIITQEEGGNYELNPAHAYFALVVPEDSINLVINPECYDTYGYEVLNSLVSPVADVTHRGANSMLVQPVAAGGGILNRPPEVLAANRHYTFSVDVKSISGGMIDIHFGDSDGDYLGSATSFWAPTFWVRKSVTIWTGSFSVQTLVVRSMDDINFYVDGFQLEDKPYATTFISGNIEAQSDVATPGRLHYGWMGAVHRSASFRTRFAGSGGRPIPLHELGLQVTDFSGFGYAAPEVITAALALRSDRVYRGSFMPERQFTIGGYLQGDNLVEMLRKRKALGYQAYGSEAEPGPVTIQIQFHEGDHPLHELAEVECVYMGGLEGVISNLYQEKVTVTFKSLRPFLRLDGNRGMALDMSAFSYNSPVSVIYEDGTIDALPDGGVTWFDDQLPMHMALAGDGLLYMASGDSLWKFSRASCSQIAATVISNAKMKDIVVAGDGLLYYIFEDEDDGSPTGSIRSYNPYTGAISTLGNVVFSTNIDDGPDLVLWRLRYDPVLNYLYVCGNFGSVTSGGAGIITGGVEPTGIVRLDMNYGLWSGFPELSDTPYDDEAYAVHDCAPSPNGLWVVGSFTTEEGGTWAKLNSLNQWEVGNRALNHIDATPPGTPLGSNPIKGPYCCLYEPRYGQLYVGGNFVNYSFFDLVTSSTKTFRLGYGICVIDTASGFINRIGYGVMQSNPFYVPFVNDLTLSPDGKKIYVAGQFNQVVDTTSSDLTPDAGSITYRDAYGICVIDVDTDDWKPMSIVMPGMDWSYTASLLNYADSVIAPKAIGANNAYGALAAPAYTQWYGDMSSAGIVNNRGAVYISHGDFGATTASPMTTVNISPGARMLARLEVKGPCVLRRVINATSGAAMAPNMLVNPGETMIFSFAPGNVWVRSTTRAVEYANLGKDSWPDLHFVSGQNNIVLELSGIGVGAATNLYWREEFAAIEALLP